MGRPNRMWWWAAGSCWASTVGGVRRRFGTDPSEAGRAKAQRELHRLLAVEPGRAVVPVVVVPVTVGEVINRYADYAADTLTPSALLLYHKRLRGFRESCGDLPWDQLKPLHVNEWIASKAWADTTKRTAIGVVKRAFAWAAQEGYIDRDPVAKVGKPPVSRRQAIPSAEVVQQLRLACTSPSLRDFLEAIIQTGCRPGEAAKVEAKDFDPVAATWTIQGKTTRKTGRLRVVYLTPSIVEDCRRLAAEHPTGPLYRNHFGRPWSVWAYGDSIRRIRNRIGLGPEVVAYAMRHVFATDALERGVPIATVAELMGHTSTAMVSLYYSHLGDRASHLREALGVIRPEVKRDASGYTAPEPEAGAPSPSAPPAPVPGRRRGPKP